MSQSCIIFDEVNIDSHGETEYTAMNHKKETFYISWPFIFSVLKRFELIREDFHFMFSHNYLNLRPAERLPADRVDSEYRKLRLQVFLGIFIGYAGYYFVRKTFH